MNLRSTIIIVCIIFIFGCSSKKEENNLSKQTTSQQKRAFLVEVDTVKTQDVVYTISAIGSLEAIEEVKIAARVNGVAENVRFNEGDRVDEETVLLEIDPARYALQADRAKATYEKAKAILHEAESALNKRIALKKIDAGWVSDEEITSYTAQVETATASLHEAKAVWGLAEQDKKYSSVAPPIKGIINAKFVTNGQYLTPDKVTATMIDMGKLRLRFKVSETESTKLSTKTVCNFRVKPIPQKQFKATIYHVSQTADPTNRMIECLAWVDNPGEILRSGFFAEISIEAQTHKKAIVVPSDAVLPTEKGFAAFVIENGIAKGRLLQLGLNTKDGKVEVLSGLQEGESLVIHGGNVLKDGVPVEIVK